MSHDHDHSHHAEDSIDPRLVAAATEGCEESRLLVTRRSLMGLSAGFFASAMIPDTALSATTDMRLLVVILRGGMDALHVAIPQNDRTYDQFRSQLYSQLKSTIPLNSEPGYVLHPSLVNFGAMFNRGEAAIVEGVAPPYQERSHFACQFNLESGQDANNTPHTDGWLNRMIGKMKAIDRVNPYNAVSIGASPMILQGPAKILSWSPVGRNSGYPAAARTILADYYRKIDPTPGKLLEAALSTDRIAYQSGDINVTSPLGSSSMLRSFVGAARLMAANDGPRIGVISVEAWDTHMNEGGGLGISGRLAVLDEGLKAFKDGLGAVWNNTVVLCVTEFGRTLDLNKQDGSCGSEHGVGSIALLAGGNVRGGKFYGERPNLAAVVAAPVRPSNISGRYELPAPIDTRKLFQSVIYDHLGLDARSFNSAVFPKTDALLPTGLKGMFKTSPVAGTFGAATGVSAPVAPKGRRTPPRT